ncbi:MAG: MBL fold metallo-hydrolase [Deltaproteobacteria bacterium]|nr:MBL fold metallo-hydrolase [Deltaproteobacteria bacterium]
MKEKAIAAPAPDKILSFGPIRFVPGKKGGRYPYCHSLILTGDETWVVDPASDKDFLTRLARNRGVARVFISHFHEDHQKYNYLFPEAHFHVPAPEAAAFTSMEAIFDLMGLEDPRYLEYWRETLVREFRFRPLKNLTPYEPGRLFQNGEVILEIIRAPGHTPGHSCFLFPHQELIFLADVDLSPFGPWYGDAASDLDALEATLDRLEHIRARTYLTAHEQGVFTPEEFEMGLAHFRRVIRDREARLVELLKTPHTLSQLVARRLIYGKVKEPPFVYDHIEAQMVDKHLERLLRRGVIISTPQGYVVAG